MLRVRDKNRRRLATHRQTRLFALVAALVTLPPLAVTWVVVATTQSDLSDLTPVGASPEGATILRWSALVQKHPPALPPESLAIARVSVRVLGYMLDGSRHDQASDFVHEFTLVPDVGNVLHPAHQFPDQTIEVWLDDDSRIRFTPRTLVWAQGTFRVAPLASGALYRLEKARVQIADRTDVQTFFR
jgi:hypothetical protein